MQTFSRFFENTVTQFSMEFSLTGCADGEGGETIDEAHSMEDRETLFRILDVKRVVIVTERDTWNGMMRRKGMKER